MSGLLCFTHVPSHPHLHTKYQSHMTVHSYSCNSTPPPLYLKIMDTTLPETTYTETIASLNDHIHRRLVLNVSDMVVIWIWWQSLCW